MGVLALLAEPDIKEMPVSGTLTLGPLVHDRLDMACIGEESLYILWVFLDVHANVGGEGHAPFMLTQWLVLACCKCEW